MSAFNGGLPSVFVVLPNGDKEVHRVRDKTVGSMLDQVATKKGRSIAGHGQTDVR